MQEEAFELPNRAVIAQRCGVDGSIAINHQPVRLRFAFRQQNGIKIVIIGIRNNESIRGIVVLCPVRVLDRQRLAFVGPSGQGVLVGKLLRVRIGINALNNLRVYLVPVSLKAVDLRGAVA